MNEQNELLKAALRLIDALRNEPQAVLYGKCKDDIATIEKHRPKPRLVEGWAADYGYPCPTAIHCGETLERVKALCPNAKRYIPVREVTDPPKWERWVLDGNTGLRANGMFLHHTQLDRIVEARNAEMERFEKAWKGGE